VLENLANWQMKMPQDHGGIALCMTEWPQTSSFDASEWSNWQCEENSNYGQFCVLCNQKLINFRSARWLSCWSMRFGCRKSHDRCKSGWTFLSNSTQNVKNKNQLAALEKTFHSSELLLLILKSLTSILSANDKLFFLAMFKEHNHESHHRSCSFVSQQFLCQNSQTA